MQRMTFTVRCLPSIMLSRVGSGHVTRRTYRTHTCGEMNSEVVGDRVTLCGWVQHLRMDKFMHLRDSYGHVQVLIPKTQAECVNGLNAESVVQIHGVVSKRPKHQINMNYSSGEVEVLADTVKVLNKCSNDLPFSVTDIPKVKESLRLENRHIELRGARLQWMLRQRSRIIHAMRRYLAEQQGFVEVETPTLFRKTPGGAKEFLVPTQQKGKFYTLPQSPQQFKQMLMVGGLDRYYQVARCYRDEGSRPDRQPEFTQLDLEMSFADDKEVQEITEGVVQAAWPEHLGEAPPAPFSRLTYQHALRHYGSDKPDRRFKWLLQDLTDLCKDALSQNLDLPEGSICKAIVLPQARDVLEDEDFEQLRLDAKQMGLSQDIGIARVDADGRLNGALQLDAVSSALVERCTLEPGDVAITAAGSNLHVNAALGRIRLKAADILEGKGIKVRDHSIMDIFWVVDFPLFLSTEDGGIESAHHPFTAPVQQDEHLLKSSPLKVRALHYDLVLNGQEVGGGSVRICNAQLQRYILHDILKEDTEDMDHLLTALASGCPPHAGIALGLDRFIAVLLGASSIRDVIAFPKTGNGKDLLSGSPSSVTEETLKSYHIKVRE